MPSKSFGPTTTAADTLGQIGSTYQMPPYDSVIYKIRVATACVTDAKIASGHVMIETVNRSYHFAIGGGGAGAATSATVAPEDIDCAIPVPKNSNVLVYALTGDIATDLEVCIQFATSNVAVVARRTPDPAKFRTLAAGGVSGSGDTAADTEESFTASTKLTRATLQPEFDGRIYQIRVAGSGVVNAKASATLIKLYIANESGPYEYVVLSGSGGATDSNIHPSTVVDIPEGIPIHATSAVDVKITSAEALKAPTISLSYW